LFFPLSNSDEHSTARNSPVATTGEANGTQKRSETKKLVAARGLEPRTYTGVLVESGFRTTVTITR